MTDEEILARLELDPETGIREVLARHGPLLLGRLRAYVRQRSYGDLNVEDVFQEALLRLVDPANRAELKRAGGEILPWLSRWGYWRLDDAARNSGLPLAETMQAPEAADPGPVSPAVRAMGSVIHLLSPRHRLILRLRYGESHSNAEVAATLGITEGAAKKAGHDARERLRILMHEAGFDTDERG
jgi:RNA polymerase sigma factor (sigma-70 family)